MEKEFNLSEFVTEINYDISKTCGNCRLVGGNWIREKRIKEFIRLLKEYPDDSRSDYVIDKLAGEKFA